MLNGLSLFSGIGGIDLALAPWVRTVAYCENERYAQAVLLSRMRSGELCHAPIWDDVQTLRGDSLGNWIDIIFGGFPCQDISVAGVGRGLDGKRSGLFFEIIRLVEETGPSFVFLENVPAIRSRGLARVCYELARLGFDLRWTTLAAAEVGAPHLRRRWFLLAANAERLKLRKQQGGIGRQSRQDPSVARDNGKEKSMADSNGERLEERIGFGGDDGEELTSPFGAGWWTIEPDVGRVAHGIPARVDRLRGLGNGVVPAQAREAFVRLAGVTRS